MNYDWDEDEYNNPWQDPDLLERLYIGDVLKRDRVTQTDVAEALDCSASTIGRWVKEYELDEKRGLDYESVALFSGGYDSLVATHYAMENDMCDAVLHLDTTTGIPENEDYVREVCQEYDWPLEIRSAKKTLKEFALEWGFPKAGSHSWAYRYFKEHTLSRFTTELNCEQPEYYTGVRKDESERRMRNITAREQESGHGRWLWIAHIMDWTEEDVEDYMEEHDLPKNPVVEDIHRSGECYCGAYANRVEELVVLEAEYPDHAQWLDDIEEEVQEEIGTDEDYCWWGSSGMSSEDLEELMEEGRCPSDPMLCVDCEGGDYTTLQDN